MSMMLYVAEVYGKIKPGVTKTVKSRIISYDKGNNSPIIHSLYVAVEGYDEHVKNCENYLNRQLFPFLENPNGNHKPSEYINPAFKHVDATYVCNVIEDRIKSHPLRIRKVKATFLPITRYTVKTVTEGIKNFPDKYLVDVA